MPGFFHRTALVAIASAAPWLTLGCSDADSDYEPMRLDCQPDSLMVGEDSELLARVEIDIDLRLQSPLKWQGPQHLSSGAGLWRTETPIDDAQVDLGNGTLIYLFSNRFTAYSSHSDRVTVTAVADFEYCCDEGEGSDWKRASMSRSCSLTVAP